MTTVVRSDEIMCGGCTSSIEKGMVGLPGVLSVAGDPQTKRVTIEHDPSVDTHAILAKMDELGFAAEIVD